MSKITDIPTRSTELDEFEKWSAERGHYAAAPLIQNFRSYKIRMKEMETIAQLRQAGQAHVENN